MNFRQYPEGHLIALARANIQELREGINRHGALLEALATRQPLKGKCDSFVVPCPDQRNAQLVAAIRRAIDVLEESRKSFKSKRLEGLRKYLTSVLIDYE